MNKREERLYYQWIEDIIRSQTNVSSFFENKSKEKHDIEIMFLVNYIQKNNPKLFKRLLSATVNATELSSSTRQDIYNFLGKTEKGTAIIWKDKNNNEFVFINSGEGSTLLKKRIVVLGNSTNKNNIEQLKKSIFSELLRKDVEFVFKRIQKKEQIKYDKIPNYFISNFFSTKSKEILHSSSSFEKDFKNIIRTLGVSASPMLTAHVMIKSMNNFDKQKLQNSFSSIGVNSRIDLQNLLSRWKDEALTAEHKTIKKIIHLQSNQSFDIFR